MSATVPSTDPPIGMVRSSIFQPYYTPKEMLTLGVFGGAFFGSSNAQKILSTGPLTIGGAMDSLFRGLPKLKYESPIYDPNQNYIPGQTLAVQRRGLNMPSYIKRLNPFGWFEWYVNWYYGCVSQADNWRISQWQKSINVHWLYIANGVYTGGGNKFTDLTYLPMRRQRLIELGWDPTIDPEKQGLKINF